MTGKQGEKITKQQPTETSFGIHYTLHAGTTTMFTHKLGLTFV